jgi:hypothetical protein
MYTLNKNEIEMYVTTIHNAYPDAPEAAMEAMRERFAEIILEDNFLAEAHKRMDTLNTAILINNLSRHHLTSEMAFDVIRHFDDNSITSQIHSQWPDEQMEERIQIIAQWHIPTTVETYQMPQLATTHETKKTISFLPAFVSHFLKPSIS